MLKKLILLAVGTYAVSAFKKYMNATPATASSTPKRAHHPEAEQRWEDEGGMVPSVSTPASGQRRRNANTAATNTAA